MVYKSSVEQSSEGGTNFKGGTKDSKLFNLVHVEHAAECQLPNHSESGRVSDDRYVCLPILTTHQVL